jgi:hypothetical protein
MDCQSMAFVLWTRLFGGKLSAFAIGFRPETRRSRCAEDLGLRLNRVELEFWGAAAPLVSNFLTQEF